MAVTDVLALVWQSRDRRDSPTPHLGFLLPSFSDGYSMLAPTPPPHTITHSQSRPLRETLLLALVVFGTMIVGGVFLYFVTEGLLWLEGYVRDQFINAGSISG
jgi:hypothetical protein